MLSIGAFSKLSNVTSKTLRYYDEIGLVKPAYVNNENGYRYYDTEQLKTILLINKLKMYCFSLEEITQILNRNIDIEQMLALMKEKKSVVHEKRLFYDYVVHEISNDIANMERGIDIMSYLDDIKVTLVETKPINVLFYRVEMNVADYGKYMGILMEKIAKEKLTVTGAPMSIHHGLEFDPENYDMEIAIPIKEVNKDTREIKGMLCASATLKGPYTKLTSAYAKIMEWVDAQGYERMDAPYEIYLTNPANTAPEDFLTEIYFPVKKV